jgi:hypothetical protein
MSCAILEPLCFLLTAVNHANDTLLLACLRKGFVEVAALLTEVTMELQAVLDNSFTDLLDDDGDSSARTTIQPSDLSGCRMVGIDVFSLENSLTQRRILVFQVDPGSNADRAGLHQGCEILRIGDQSVWQLTDADVVRLLGNRTATSPEVVFGPPSVPTILAFNDWQQSLITKVRSHRSSDVHID